MSSCGDDHEWDDFCALTNAAFLTERDGKRPCPLCGGPLELDPVTWVRWADDVIVFLVRPIAKALGSLGLTDQP